MWTINMATSMKCSMHALPISPQTPKSIVHIASRVVCHPCRGSIWLYGASIYGCTGPAIQLHRDMAAHACRAGLWLHRATGMFILSLLTSFTFILASYSIYLTHRFTYTSLYTQIRICCIHSWGLEDAWFADMLANARALLIQVQRGL